jgi:hypothetical protein
LFYRKSETSDIGHDYVHSTPKPSYNFTKSPPRHAKPPKPEYGPRMERGDESPYKQKKHEIDEMISKRYYDLNMKASNKCKWIFRFWDLEQFELNLTNFDGIVMEKSPERLKEKSVSKPKNKFKHMKVPYFGNYKDKRKRNVQQRLK